MLSFQIQNYLGKAFSAEEVYVEIKHMNNMANPAPDIICVFRTSLIMMSSASSFEFLIEEKTLISIFIIIIVQF